MKKNTFTLTVIISLIAGFSFNSKGQHSAGLGVAAGPAFKTGFSHVVTFGAEYKYHLLNEHLGVGAKIGLANIGLDGFVSVLASALGGSSETGATAFLGVVSIDYYVLTKKWKPYVSFDIGGVANGKIDDSKAYKLNGLVASPGIGTRFAISKRFDLDAAFRFPIFVNASATGDDNTLGSMTVGLGAHYKFGAK